MENLNQIKEGNNLNCVYKGLKETFLTNVAKENRI